MINQIDGPIVFIMDGVRRVLPLTCSQTATCHAKLSERQLRSDGYSRCAAVADGRGEPWNFIDFSKAVIADVGPISSLAPIQNSKAVIRGDRSIFASGCRHCSVSGSIKVQIPCPIPDIPISSPSVVSLRLQRIDYPYSTRSRQWEC